MPLIERYVLRRAAQVFLLTLCALTAALWVTLLLRELDVVTAKGQAIWVYLLMTILALPPLVQIVAPIALLVGIIITLNSLTNDSELPIISAAGASHKAVNRPIVVLGCLVMAAVALSYHVMAPASLSAFRTILAQVRADVIATLVQEGGFRALESGLTMSFRQRTPDGGFRDVFINDERDPQESRTFFASRGLLLEHAGGSFLVLQEGDLVRENVGNAEAGIVNFETYALDLRQFGPADAAPVYKAMERSTLFLWNPPQDDVYAQIYPLKVTAEVHDRITAPLYTVAFALVALGFLGRPRTNRQDRSMAILAVVSICLIFRTGGFAAFTIGRQFGAAIPFLYAIPLAGLAFGVYANLRDTRAWITPRLDVIADMIARIGKRISGRELTPAGLSDGQ